MVFEIQPSDRLKAVGGFFMSLGKRRAWRIAFFVAF
jgi:hypothetical protein